MNLQFLHGFFLLLGVHSAAALATSEGLDLCRRIYDRSGGIETFADAFAAFPNDPVSRALYIQAQGQSAAIPFALQPSKVVSVRTGRLSRSAVETYDWLVPQTVAGGHPSIRAIPDLDLNTVRYASPNDLSFNGNFIEIPGAPPRKFKEFKLSPHLGSQYIVNWTHGLTAMFSNGGSVFNQLKLMNAAKPHSTLQAELETYWIETTAVSVDLPFHGAGSSHLELFQLAATLEWRRLYYLSLHETGLPLAAGTRSGENLLLAQSAFDHPDLIQKMIWMSPMHPTVGFNESIKGTDAESQIDKATFNGTALRWFAGAMEQLIALPKERRWWESPLGVPDVPILILIGSEDKEVSQPTRDHYRTLAKRNPKLIYIEVPGAGHDVFAVTEDVTGAGRRWTHDAEARAIGAWQYVYWFLRLGEHNSIAEPELGWRR